MAPSTTLRTSTSHRRAAGVLATAALASLLTVTPAFARPYPGEPILAAGAPQPRPDGSTLQYSAPSSGSQNHRGAGATTEENRLSRAQMSPKAPAPGTTTTTDDDDAVEYLQLALGAHGGFAAAGAIAAAASTRRHGHAHTTA